MFRVSLTVAVMFCATGAVALSDAQRDRALAAFAEIERKTHAVYIAASPDFAPLLVSVADDAKMQEITVCVLEEVEATGQLDAYIDALEMQAARQFENLLEMSDGVPEVMLSDDVLAASMSCGGPEYMQEKQMTEAFIEVLMRPDVRARLTGTGD